MILLKLLVLGLVSSVFASTYVLSKRSNLKCFPVHANDRISVKFLEYAIGRFYRDNLLAFLFYREKDLEVAQAIEGERIIPHICDKQAIERGFCLEEHRGGISYQYKDPEASHSQVFSAKMFRYEEIVDFYEVKENDVYCALIYEHEHGYWNIEDSRVDDYEVGIIVDYRYKPSLEKRQLYKVVLLNSVTLLISSLPFIHIWKKWSSSNDTNPPFVIKLLQVFTGLRILPTIVYFLPLILSGLILDIDLHLKYDTFTDMLQITALFIDITSRYGMLFYVYQYSADFTFDRPSTLKRVKTFTIAFCIESILFFGDLIESEPKNLNVMLTATSVSLFIFNQLSLFMIFLRYRSSVKKFQRFNKTADPKLRQFRWLILSRLFIEFHPFILGKIWVIIMGIGLGILQFLPNNIRQSYLTYIIHLFRGYRENFMFNDYIDIPFKIGEAILNYYVFNVIWSPESYEKTIAYKSLD